MTDTAARRTHAQMGPADRVGLATVAAQRFVTAVLERRSLVRLGMAQATLAAVLALAVAFLTPSGLAVEFILGGAAVMLVVSGTLLGVWSDADDRARIANWRGVDYERRQAEATASAGD